jgi:hypothetical protein
MPSWGGLNVHRELFYVEDAPPPETTHAEPPAGPGAEVTSGKVTMRRNSALDLRKSRPDTC